MCPEKQSDVILFGFLSTSIFTDDYAFVMNIYEIDSLFTSTLELKPSAPSKVCLICTGPGFALAMMFSTVSIRKSRQTTNVSEMTSIC